MMKDGCGPHTLTPFAHYDQGSLLWRTLQLSWDHPNGELFLGTWPKRGMMLNGDCYALPMSAHRTSESVSSLLPTPKAMESPSTRGITLTDAVALKLLPTAAADWRRYESAIGRWESLTRHAPPPLDEKDRLNAAFVEWMMGAPEGWTEGLSRTAAIHGLGNGVVIQVAEEVGKWAKCVYEQIEVEAG